MRRLLAVLLVFGFVVACDDDAPTGTDGEVEFTVMTRNIYVGSDIDLLMLAPSLEEIPLLAAEAWLAIQGTDFADRVEALADEIEAAGPHLVGLQEVSLFRAQSPGDFLVGNPQPATTVVLDHLDLLLDALEARGLSYREVAVSQGMDVEVPMAVSPTEFDDMRLTDHEVILARNDVYVSNVDERNFTTNLEIELGGPGGPALTVLRGWVAVDATTGGKTVRFVSTHLEPPEYAPAVQLAQAAELMSELAGETLPVIVLGDLNSNADGTSTTTYADFLAAGYSDAWAEAGAGAGLTCCHQDDLQNATTELVKRIDYILFRGALEALSADVVGDDPAERTAGGLWASDHAGVVATLRAP
ncbi:MAG: endonuclease/exonuclease/phosphatase family protein [Gemmatimonadota bacterium]|nr:MAG: endonuclease/exonuclease/phosphatase family protein [Gemmatimonadota bacterium]